MADSCPEINHCRTHASGWLNGAHPTVAEGIVTRQVCYHWSGKCCNWSNNIRVRQCSGGFFVYELVKPPVCHLRYCTSSSSLAKGKWNTRMISNNKCTVLRTGMIMAIPRFQCLWGRVCFCFCLCSCSCSCSCGRVVNVVFRRPLDAPRCMMAKKVRSRAENNQAFHKQIYSIISHCLIWIICFRAPFSN